MEADSSLSVKDAARFLRVSVSTVYRLIDSGVLPAERDTTGRLFIRRDVLESVAPSFDAGSARSQARSARTSAHRTEGDASRRSFMKGAYSFVLAVLANLLGSAGATLIYSRFADAVKDKQNRLQLDAERDRLAQRLFGGLSDFSWSAGLTHLVRDYGLDWVEQSSNVLASASLGAVLHGRALDWMKNAVYTDNLPGFVAVDADIIAVGSPTSDPVARAALEYRGSRYRLTRATDAALSLPITFSLDQEQLGRTEVHAKRFVAGAEREMPNWSVTVDDRERLIPKLRSDGWLISDFLLISRIPNILNERSYLSGREILIVSGAHGVGTEAIELLVQDLTVLRVANAERRDSAFFQVLVPVLAVEHTWDGKRMHSLPRELGTPLVRSIKVDSERIRRRWRQAEVR